VLGPEEVEDFARARRGVGVVGEADDLAGGLEQEAQRRVVLAPFEVGGGVTLGLSLGGGEVLASAVFLGFDHAHGVAIDEQHVVGRAGVGGVLAHGHAKGRSKVELPSCPARPSRPARAWVDLLPGFGFWRHACRRIARLLSPTYRR
jgi:hypothetical protein